MNLQKIVLIAALAPLATGCKDQIDDVQAVEEEGVKTEVETVKAIDKTEDALAFVTKNSKQSAACLLKKAIDLKTICSKVELDVAIAKANVLGITQSRIDGAVSVGVGEARLENPELVSNIESAMANCDQAKAKARALYFTPKIEDDFGLALIDASIVCESITGGATFTIPSTPDISIPPTPFPNIDATKK